MYWASSFFLSALSAIIILAFTNEKIDALLYSHILNFFGIGCEYMFLMRLLFSMMATIFIAMTFAFFERIIHGRSLTKYHVVFGKLLGEMLLASSKLNIKKRKREYWNEEIDKILHKISEIFASCEAKEKRIFSAAIYVLKEDQDVGSKGKMFLAIDRHGESESISEDPIKKFDIGEGFIGVAYDKLSPQSGGQRKRFRRDERYKAPINVEFSAKSFFSTPLLLNKNDKKNVRYVFGIATDNESYFGWDVRHAINIYRGLYPCLTLIKLCLDMRDAC